MHQQAVVHREERHERSEGRPTEVEHEPHDKERERGSREDRAGHRGGHDPKGEQRRDDRKAAVIYEVARDEPAQDRTGPVAVVLLGLEVRAHTGVRRLGQERIPQPRRGYRGGNASDHITRQAAEHITSRPCARDHDHEEGDRHHVRIDEVREDQCGDRERTPYERRPFARAQHVPHHREHDE